MCNLLIMYFSSWTVTSTSRGTRLVLLLCQCLEHSRCSIGMLNLWMLGKEWYSRILRNDPNLALTCCWASERSRLSRNIQHKTPVYHLCYVPTPLTLPFGASQVLWMEQLSLQLQHFSASAFYHLGVTLYSLFSSVYSLCQPQCALAGHILSLSLKKGILIPIFTT